MIILRRFILTAVLAAASLLLVGCGAWQRTGQRSAQAYNAVFHQRATQLRLALTAGPHLNADDSGRPYALRVLVIQLKDRKAFDDAGYDMLARGTASLGDAVIDATEVSLVAGSSQVVDRPLHQDTRFVGIAAFYHRPGDGWRGVVERHALPPRRPLPVRMDCGQVLMTLR